MKAALTLLRQGKVAGICVLLTGIVVWAFLPSLSNGFINYDDPSYVYANPHVRGGLTWENIGWAFRTLERGFWHPLTWLSIMLDWQLFAGKASGHHLTSLVLHAANTVLLFMVLGRATGAIWRSTFVAALFALHPLHVESVAWASGRKDVLSTFFLMLTLWAYLFYVQSSASRNRRAVGWYLVTLALFICALMSKAMVVTLPLLLALLDWWPLSRIRWPHWEAPGIETGNSTTGAATPATIAPVDEGREKRPFDPPVLDPTELLPGSAPSASSSTSTFHCWALVREKLPFLGVAVVFGVITMFAQKELGALQTSGQLPMLPRLANAVLSVGTYLGQTFWPANLAVFYAYPKTFAIWKVAGTALLCLAVSAFVWKEARRRPFLAFGWIWYLTTLLPVIGLLQAGTQAHADRYTYVPLIGVFVFLVWGANGLVSSCRFTGVAFSSIVVAATVLFAACTRQQLGYWKDSETLFRHALAVTKDNPVAHRNLGTMLMKRGKMDEAIVHLQEAVRLAPDYAMARVNFGAALLQTGHLDESIIQSQEALRLNPALAGAHLNLGIVLGARRRTDDALVHLGEAVRMEPSDPQARYFLGLALASKGRFDEALASFQEALKLKPDLTDAQRGIQAVLAARAASQKNSTGSKHP